MKLVKGAALNIGRRRGAQIRIEEGALWLTLDRDMTDYVLKAGDTKRLDGRRAAIVSALKDSRFQVLEPDVATGAFATLIATLSKKLQPQG